MESADNLLKITVVLLLIVNIFSAVFIIHEVDELVSPIALTGNAAASSVASATFCVNHPPSFIDFNCNDVIVVGEPFYCHLNITDADANSINYTVLNTTLFNISLSGDINFTPTTSDIGQYSAIIVATDNSGCSLNNSTKRYAFSIILTNATWTNATLPEGIYSIQPAVPPQAGSYKYSFNITLQNVTADAGDILGCHIKESNCYDTYLPGCRQIFVNKTLLSSIISQDVVINYTLSSSDVVNTSKGGNTSVWIPWRIINCTHVSNGTLIYNRSLNWRIHIHGINWTSGDIANAVNAKSIENQFMFNTIKTDNVGDISFALSKYNGLAVEEYCHDNIDSVFESDTLVDTADPDCWGITYSNRQDLHQAFNDSLLYYSPSGSHGTLAFNIPSGDIDEDQTSSMTFNTNIGYTMHTMPNGTFRIRFSKWGLSKIATIIMEGFPQITHVTKYAPGSDESTGLLEYFIDKNGQSLKQNILSSSETYRNKVIIKSFDNSQEISNLDTVVNISFNSSDVNMSEGYIITLTFNYVEGADIYTEQKNITIYFDDITYGPPPRWTSYNDREDTVKIDGATWGPCNDTKNGDFDYISCSGEEQICFDQKSYDCYDLDCNMKSGTSAWNDYASTYTTGLCAYYNESQTSSMCFDGYNNDWATEDSSWGHVNTGLSLIDCRDPDCDNITNGSIYCQYNRERNCTDNFDNDLYNAKDCQRISDGSWDYNDAEYDCAAYCRSTIDNKEEGVECDDLIDNDWDLYMESGANGYAYNTTKGAGIDCNWITQHPDYDCNTTYLSNGKRCEIQFERTCNDEFDNDYDNNYNIKAGWSQLAYEQYYSTRFASGADYDDYDCYGAPGVAKNESINKSWCFDNTDNDLDAYYWNGLTYAANLSTGKNCRDPDCIGVVNPLDDIERCMNVEYNSSDPFFQNIWYSGYYCDNDIDDDLDGQTDCYDSDCAGQFGLCGPCPSYENVSWNSCFNNLDDDYQNSLDCADPSCRGWLGDSKGYICTFDENNDTLCSDGLDNDADGNTDCLDASCNGFAGCGAELCTDDIDNDGDGKIDCADTDCDSVCDINSNINSSNYFPTTSTSSFGSASVTWDSRVKQGDNFTIMISYSGSYDSANIIIGNLLGDGIDTGTGLNASAFSISGPAFETYSYSEDTSGSKGSINLIDQDHIGTFVNGFSVNITMPTTAFLDGDTFEYSHAISGSITTGNTIDVVILDNSSPVITNITIEPSNKDNIPYDGNVWVGVLANDSENGAYADGTIYRCYYNVSGPDGYSIPTTSDYDCKFEISNIVRSGTYNLSVWAEDNSGNVGEINTSSFYVDVNPLFVDGNFNISKVFYNSSTSSINISSSFYTDNTSGLSCTVYYRDVASLSVNSAALLKSVSGDLVECEGDIPLPSNDGLYIVWVNATEGDDETKGDLPVFFVCDNLSSSGTGLNGEKWSCVFSDFNSDGTVDSCALPSAPRIISYSPLNNTQFSYDTTTIPLSLVTDKNATCRYSQDNTDWNNMSLMDMTGNTTSHKITAIVTEGDSYDYYFLCEDDSLNRMSSSLHLHYSVERQAESIIENIGRLFNYFLPEKMKKGGQEIKLPEKITIASLKVNNILVFKDDVKLLERVDVGNTAEIYAVIENTGEQDMHNLRLVLTLPDGIEITKISSAEDKLSPGEKHTFSADLLLSERKSYPVIVKLVSDEQTVEKMITLARTVRKEEEISQRIKAKKVMNKILMLILLIMLFLIAGTIFFYRKERKNIFRNKKISNELINYIRVLRRMHVDDEDIKQRLRSAGWDEENIERYINKEDKKL